METQITQFGALALLGLGLVFGLKHAFEADHIVAISTIVGGQRSLRRAALVGGLWGVGHTISLVFVGAIVLGLRVAVPARVSGWLEFCVALMIIALGTSALLGVTRARRDVHLHRHTHDGLSHVHIHFHERETQHTPHAIQRTHTIQHTHAMHAVARLGLRPILVGAMHGLAGSAALTLLVLAQTDSAALGMLYLAVFGAGSILGMVLMSGLIGLPFALSARRVSGVTYGLQALAGLLSIAFGLWYAYTTGIAHGLWGAA